MDDSKLTPHEVNDRIHAFHDGVSRDLWVRYTHADASLSVARAYYDGYLTDDDLAEATPGVLEDIRYWTRLIQDEMAQEAAKAKRRTATHPAVPAPESREAAAVEPTKRAENRGFSGFMIAETP